MYECYGKIVTYTPTSKEIKRKRGGEGTGVAVAGKDDGKGWRRETRREGNFTYESTHVVTRRGSCVSPGEGTFSEAAYTGCARPGQTEGKRSFTSREKRATCGDNSIVHFIRSAALRYKYAYPLS